MTPPRWFHLRGLLGEALSEPYGSEIQLIGPPAPSAGDRMCGPRFRMEA